MKLKLCKEHVRGYMFRSPIIALMLFAGMHLSAQNLTVSGTITDAKDNSPLVGATVVIKGTTTGTVSNVNGKYTMNNVPRGAVLEFGYVGYVSLDSTVTSPTLNVRLSVETTELGQVVYTALGIQKEKKKVGYALQEVKGQDLVKARDANPITGLTGKVAGLSVGASAELLRKPTVLLRGNEITLYVVDGVPISSDTWNLSPDDIESYTVLKGPAAAALYGSRAQSGAILITTKKGMKGRKAFTVEINSTNSFDKGFLAYPRLQHEYGPGENELYAFVDGKGAGLNDNDYDIWGPKFRGQLIPQWDGEYTPNKTYTTVFPGGLTWTGHIKPTPYIARGTKNLQNFLQTGFQTTDNVAVTASGKDYDVRFSLSQSYQRGIVPNTKLNISNFNLYGSYDFNDKLSIEGNINFNYQYTPNFPDVNYGPNSVIYDIAVWTGDDWNINQPKIKNIWQPGKVGILPYFAEYQRYHNPWAMADYWLRGHYKTDIYGYVSSNYKFDDHLNLNLRTQVTTYNLFRNEKMPVWAHPYGREQNLGDYREDKRNLFENNSDIQLNYKYILGHFFVLSGLAGGSIRLFSYNSSFTTTDYLSVPGVYSFSNSKNPLQVNNFESGMRVFSGYASMDIDVDKYATISLTGRVDKSSAILSHNDTYFYPSISLASDIKNYIKLPDLINSFKIRGSFASVRAVPTSETIGTAPFNTITALGYKVYNDPTIDPANSNIHGYPLDYGNNYYSPYGGPDYSLNPVYNTSKPYNNQTAATYTDNLYDPNIKPSNRINYEAGFDMRLLQNRLGLSATVFEYIDGPQILPNAISTTSGYSTYYINGLKTKKAGLELTLSGTPIRSTSNGLTWDVLVNWSNYKETYLKLPAGQDVYNTFFHKGDRVDKFYGSAFVRTKDGQIINDNAGKPLVNPTAQFLGYLNGKFIWSFYNKFSYKNLYLDFQVDGNVGGVIVDLMHLKTMRGGRNIETVQGAFGAARNEDDLHAGDTTSVNNPKHYFGTYVGAGVVVSNGQAINYNSQTGAITNYGDLQFTTNTKKALVQDYVSSYYGTDEANLMSKTYAKLREVSIGYNLPSKWLQKTIVSKVTVSLVSRNLLYFYGDKRFRDVDLDQYNQANPFTVLQTPTTRRYGFNINVVF